MNQHQHSRVVDAAQRQAAKIAHADVDGHPHTPDGTMQYDAFAMKFDSPHAAVRAGVLRMEADGKRERVEPQCTARPGGIDPACCSLTPPGFDFPPGVMFPVDTQDRSPPASGLV